MNERIEQLYLSVVEFRVESRREWVVEGSCGFLHFRGCAGSNSSASNAELGGRPGFLIFSGRSAVFRSRRRGERGKHVDNPFPALFSGFGLWAWIAHILPTLPLVGVV